MLAKLSLKIKILVLSLLTLLAMVFLGMSALNTISKLDAIVSKDLNAIESNGAVFQDIQNAHINFKGQVQQWKNVLIRGNSKDGFEKYFERFTRDESIAKKYFADAVEHGKSAGMDTGAIENVAKLHAELGQIYREGLKSFDARNSDAGKVVDKVVKGVDRPSVKAMTEISTAMEEEFSNLIHEATLNVKEQYQVAKSQFIQIMVISTIVLISLMGWIFYDLIRVLGGEPAYTAKVVKDVASGRLDKPIHLKRGDKHSLLATIAQMKDQLSEIISDVRSSSDALSSAAEEISATAQSVAKGASVQAASVEETSASMEQMSASISQNNENASVTDGMAQKAAVDADNGGSAVSETVESMQKIAERIGVIDDIAYQTNLLALNAAIEAGRAGEYGRGFAVVASEVRKLAERSQVAAQDIGELAKDSVKRADLAGNLLEEMVPSIKKTADLVQEIAAASSEQATGVEQINTAIGQVNQTLQQNAAASEELSSTSEEMSSQAMRLQESIDYFKLKGYKKRHYHAANVGDESDTDETEHEKSGQNESDDLDSSFVRYD